MSSPGYPLNSKESELANVEAIRLASLRAAGLTKQLLAFSRQQEIVPQTLISTPSSVNRSSC